MSVGMSVGASDGTSDGVVETQVPISICLKNGFTLGSTAIHPKVSVG